jgi:methionyl-tRNA formyltransferase
VLHRARLRFGLFWRWINIAQLVGIITRRNSTFNSDFIDISLIAHANNVPVLFAEDAATDQEQAAWLSGLRPDLVFTVGWSRLLREEVLRIPPMGVIGFHPAALPANRGRHPLVWALALGLTETASSFFLMGVGADDGPIVSQHSIVITPTDTAQTLYDKILVQIPLQLTEIIDGYVGGNLLPQPQDEGLANCWRKRCEDDGRIDWRMSASSIYNLVRALSAPYPGAHFFSNGESFKVWHCIVEPDSRINIEPGKVLRVEGQEFVVKAGNDAIRLVNHDLANLPAVGDYL